VSFRWTESSRQILSKLTLEQCVANIALLLTIGKYIRIFILRVYTVRKLSRWCVAIDVHVSLVVGDYLLGSPYKLS